MVRKSRNVVIYQKKIGRFAMWITKMALCLFAVCLFFSEVQAETVYEIEVYFSFTPVETSKTVTGYMLYKEGAQLILWEPANIFTRTVVTALPETAYTSFTMSAVYSDGTQSSRSAPCLFNPSVTTPASPSGFMRISSMLGTALKKGTQIRSGRIGFS